MSSDPMFEPRRLPSNKKRRFVPNSIAVVPEPVSPIFNSSLFIPVYGQAPKESDVQTQLFQVGMRIRRSVNEGYRTTSRQQHLFQPVAENSTDTAVGHQSMYGSAFRTPERSRSYYSANKRAFTRDTDDDSDEADYSPMTPIMPHSDHRVQIPQDCFDINFDFDTMDDDITLSSIQDSPSQKAVLRQSVNGRRIAIPRSRRRKQNQSYACDLFQETRTDQYRPPAQQWGHERIAQKPGMEENDFGEAAFLQSREDVDMDCS